MGFLPVNSLNIGSNAPNQTNSYSLKIGSKNGSAFNNLRNIEHEKATQNQQQQQQQ